MYTEYEQNNQHFSSEPSLEQEHEDNAKPRISNEEDVSNPNSPRGKLRKQLKIIDSQPIIKDENEDDSDVENVGDSWSSSEKHLPSAAFIPPETNKSESSPKADKAKSRKRGKSEVIPKERRKSKKSNAYIDSNHNGMHLMIEPEKFLALQNEFLLNQMQSLQLQNQAQNMQAFNQPMGNLGNIGQYQGNPIPQMPNIAGINQLPGLNLASPVGYQILSNMAERDALYQKQMHKKFSSVGYEPYSNPQFKNYSAMGFKVPHEKRKYSEPAAPSESIPITKSPRKQKHRPESAGDSSPGTKDSKDEGKESPFEGRYSSRESLDGRSIPQESSNINNGFNAATNLNTAPANGVSYSVNPNNSTITPTSPVTLPIAPSTIAYQNPAIVNNNMTPIVNTNNLPLGNVNNFPGTSPTVTFAPVISNALPPISNGNNAVAPTGQLATIQLSQPAPINMNSPNSSSVTEKERVASIHSLGILDSSDQPRLNRITQMTLRLVGGNCCVLSIVDVDRVVWKSSAWASGSAPPYKDEARYESFCSWVVQDETGRGVTVLDAKTDPRCTHMKIRPGLEFYAGVPLVTMDKKKIGALSIRGPARGQISVIDMNILHEMAVWASGEIDTISQQKLIESKHTMLDARFNLSKMIESLKQAEKGFELTIFDQALTTIRKSLNASYVLLLKIIPDGVNIKCSLLAHSATNNPTATQNLISGQEMFQELALATLKKEPNQPLVLDQLNSGPITKDVDQYLNKNILRCASEIVWSNRQPAAILAVFYQGVFHYVTDVDLQFIKTVSNTMSELYSRLELSESFISASIFLKPISQAIKKSPMPFGKWSGLAPAILLIEPVFPSVKGYQTGIDSIEEEKGQSSSGGAKGQVHAQVLQQEQLNANTKIQSVDAIAIKETLASNEVTPLSSLSIMADFVQLVDNLADRFTLKRPKRIGYLYYMVGNFGPESGTSENLAGFAHELLFAVDSYNQKTGKSLKIKAGLHCDFISTEMILDQNLSKDLFLEMVNTCYKLQKIDSVMVSDIFMHQTKDKCTYEASHQLHVRGQGTFMAYRLLGMVLNTIPKKDESVLDYAATTNSSLFLHKVPAALPTPAPPKQEIIIEERVKKSKACNIM